MIDRVLPLFLLLASNVFMTFAWYGHLKFKTLPLSVAILISWGIALFEYVLMVPANRYGYGYFNAAQLKNLVRRGVMARIYVHLLSLEHFANLLNRKAAQAGAA